MGARVTGALRAGAGLSLLLSVALPGRRAASEDGAPRLEPSPALTPTEQLALERLNALRAAPAASLPQLQATLAQEVLAQPLKCPDEPGLLDGLSVAEPRPPLAPTATLVAAARAHAGDMRDRGYFAHVSPEGVGPNERLRAAGVPLTMGVKVEGRTARYSTSPGANQVEAIQRSRQASAGRVPPGALASSSRAVDLLIIDRCVVDRGHRRHLLGVPALNAGDREVGVGVAVKEGPIPERPGWFEWLSYLDIVTVNPAHEQRYVTGVVYEDRDKDGRYSLGEGLAGQRVTLTELALATETGPGGGYSLAVPAGSAGVVQALGQAKPFTLEASNVKVDFVR